MCIKYSKKSHFVKKCRNTIQGKPLGFNSGIKNKSILENNNQIKDIREYLIKHFAFYYNSIYTVYKNTKYSTG
jgi:hypothetical protein